MKAKGKFVSFLLIVDTFFVSYAVGFNSRHVLVVDPTLPAVTPPKVEEKKDTKPAAKAEAKKSTDAKPDATKAAADKSAGSAKTSDAPAGSKKPATSNDSHKKKSAKAAHH